MNGNRGADAVNPKNGKKGSAQSPVDPQDSGSKREPRATRRTRNTTRGWGDDSDPNRFLAPKEDRTMSMAAMILAGIDADSYEYAAWDDADFIMKNHVLPKSLPWHKPRVPLLRTLPRDIEDMQGVWHAGDDSDNINRKHVNSGSFGYGMFDMGGLLKEDVKGTRAETIIAKPSNPMVAAIPLSPAKRRFGSGGREDGNSSANDEDNEIPCQIFDQIDAAARRSIDPGVIELTVKLPLPSLTASLLQCQRHNMLPRDPWVKHDDNSRKKMKSILQGERAEKCSSMPLYWSKIDKDGSYEYREPPAFSDLTNSDDGSDYEKSIFENMKKRERRKRRMEELSQACTRKWKVSVKVANVTSRTMIVSPESRPLLCAATLPSYVQSGQSLTVESAQLKDKEGLRESLGSYDCRATATNPAMSFEAMDNEDIRAGKCSGAGRAKRINVGRNRLIWSKAKVSGNRASFSSSLTGQKLDSFSYKRPKEVKVMIKINGNLLCEVLEQEEEQNRASTVNFFSQKNSWSPIKVNKALSAACGESEQHIPVQIKDNADEAPIQAQCTFEPEDYLNALVQTIKDQGKEEHQRVDTSEYKMTTLVEGNIKSTYRRPKFSVLPLEDGMLRTYCEVPGSLQGSARLPMELNKVAAALPPGTNSEPLCTICWEKSDGSGPLKVLRCFRCGLLAHRDCCLDPGKYDEKRNIWECAVCKAGPCTEFLPKVSIMPLHSESGTQVQPPLHIARSRKSQRKSRTPTRFKETVADEKKSSHAVTSDSEKNTIPKCTLCPHSGGAMSITFNEGIGAGRNQRWTHEVCRVWCKKLKTDNTKFVTEITEESDTFLQHPQSSLNELKGSEAVCCICGMGRIHNEGQSKEEILPLQNPNDACGINVPGLIRCASTGCNILFHPMCALLYTKLSAREKNTENSDEARCWKFSLELLDVIQRGGIDETDSYVVPVGFCGLHNIERREEYGCLPVDTMETKTLFDIMRIPHQDRPDP